MTGNEKEWYSNKDLFDMIQSLKEEMTQTRSIIKRYNGLRQDMIESYQKINQNEEKINEIKNTEKGKHELAETIRRWGGWLVAIASLTYAITS
jgi:inorganic pyrophosphatase